MRRGFTFVEILLSMAIVGILSTIAVPKYRDLKRRALATKILGELDVVRIASYSFFSDSAYFPREAPAGQVPENLARYLPIGFSFSNEDWTLNYENWQIGTVSFTNAPALVGVSVTTSDPALGRTAAGLLGSAPAFGMGGTVTLMISGM